MKFPSFVVCVLCCLFTSEIQAGLIGETRNELTVNLDSAHGKTFQEVKNGLLDLENGDFEGARAHFMGARRENSQDPIPLLALAKLSVMEQRSNRALEYLTEALQLAPRSAEVLISLGRYHSSVREFAQAAEYYEQATQGRDNTLLAKIDLGFLYLNQLNNAERAKDIFLQAMEIEPNSPVIRYGLALAFANLGQLHLAESQLSSVISLLPDDATAYQTLGRLYARQGKFEQSLASLTKAIALNETFLPLRMDRADVFAALGNLDKAIAEYQYVLKSAPDFALGHARLASVYEKNNQVEKAKESYRSAIKLDPNLALAYNGLAWLNLDNRSERHNAIEWARKAVSLSNGEPAYLDTLAWLHRANGNLIEAERLLKMALSKPSGESPIVLYHLGVVRHELNRSSEALLALNRALEMDANFPYAEDCRALLSKIRGG